MEGKTLQQDELSDKELGLETDVLLALIEDEELKGRIEKLGTGCSDTDEAALARFRGIVVAALKTDRVYHRVRSLNSNSPTDMTPRTFSDG